MITPTINENYNVFTEDFFAPYKSKQTNYTIELTDQITKTFKFPTLFKGTENGLGIFLCSYDKLKKHMPNPDMDPVRMPGNRAVFAISCYKYTNIQEMMPYNEISFTVPIVMKGALNIPFFTLAAKKLYSSFGYYVFSMPVNSAENNIRGHKIWGLPKFNTMIDITNKDGMFSTKIFDGDKPYIELSYPTTGGNKQFNENLSILSVKDGKLLKASVTYNGDFKVNTNLGIAFNKIKMEDSPFIKLYDTPRGKILMDLEIDPVPFQTRYSGNVLSVLNLPENY